MTSGCVFKLSPSCFCDTTNCWCQFSKWGKLQVQLLQHHMNTALDPNWITLNTAGLSNGSVGSYNVFLAQKHCPAEVSQSMAAQSYALISQLFNFRNEWRWILVARLFNSNIYTMQICIILDHKLILGLLYFHNDTSVQYRIQLYQTLSLQLVQGKILF